MQLLAKRNRDLTASEALAVDSVAARSRATEGEARVLLGAMVQTGNRKGEIERRGAIEVDGHRARFRSKLTIKLG